MNFSYIVFLVVLGTAALIAIISKNRWLKIASGIIFILGLLILIQISSIRIGQSFHVQNLKGDFEFELVPTKGRDFEMMYRWLETYKKENKITDDVELFRTEKINYFDISMWGNYRSNEYWDLEFLAKKILDEKTSK